MDVYLAVEQRGQYRPLATDIEVNNCFRIYLRLVFTSDRVVVGVIRELLT